MKKSFLILALGISLGTVLSTFAVNTLGLSNYVSREELSVTLDQMISNDRTMDRHCSNLENYVNEYWFADLTEQYNEMFWRDSLKDSGGGVGAPYGVGCMMYGGSFVFIPGQSGHAGCREIWLYDFIENKLKRANDGEIDYCAYHYFDGVGDKFLSFSGVSCSPNATCTHYKGKFYYRENRLEVSETFKDYSSDSSD